jgi:hypothetical protein
MIGHRLRGSEMKLRRSRSGSMSRSRRGSRLWVLEGLEERLLLATIYTVNSTGNGTTGTGDSGTLPYVIGQANANTNPAGSEVEFDPTVFAAPQTITLTSTLTLSETAGPEVIDGPGASLVTVSGNNRVGVFAVSDGVTATLSGLTISHGSAHNEGDFGGGIVNYGTVTVSDSTIAFDSAYLGGGINNLGTMTVSDSTISNDSAGLDGGGIDNNYLNTLTVSDSTIDNDSAGDAGGGIDSSDGTLIVSDSTIAYDSAPYGGGINNDSFGTLTVSDSAIDNDSALEETDNGDFFAGSGGGINNLGTLTVSDSTLAYDSTDTYGGGIDNNAGTLTVSDSTLAYDSAGYYGGGIDNDNNYGTLTVSESTIAYDSAGYYGGGLSGYGGRVTLNNTIVALNNNALGGTSNDIYFNAGVFSPSSAYNLIGTEGFGGLVNGVNGNQVGVADPGLGTLASNGGPTQTIALLPGSPAIDAGSNALAVDPTTGQPLTTDQRGPGFVRIVNNTVDIGAFEVQSTIHLVVTVQPPASVTAGSGFGLTVTAEDGAGDVDTSFNGTVTATLPYNPGGATLGGTLTATAQDGVATFSDLTLNKVGSGYALLVSATGLGSATTSALDVTRAAVTELAVLTQLPSGLVGSPFSLTVAAEDAFGNVDTEFGGSVTVGLAANPGGATLGGTRNVTAQDGVATFSGLTLDQPGIGYTLQVSSSGLTAATTSPFNVLSSGPTFYSVISTSGGMSGSDDTGTLPYVISQANANTNPAGSVIEFDPTVFAAPQTITLSSTLVLSETAGPEVIDGPGASLVTVSGNDSVGVFSVSGGVTATLSGLTISYGFASLGGGIDNLGALTVSDSTFTYNNGSILGGGIDNSGALTVSDSTFTYNSAFGGAGIDNEGTTVTVSDSTLTNNSASNGGGGIMNISTVIVSDSTIANDSASVGGGILNLASATVSDSTIAYDSAEGGGGGGIDNSGTMTVSNSTIANDFAGGSDGDGGGIDNTHLLTVTDSTISNNSAIGFDFGGSNGGGIDNDGTTIVSDSTIAYNSSFRGGGIDNDGTIIVSDSTIAYNLGYGVGGGIGNGTLSDDGTATLDNTIVALNTNGSGSGATPDDISSSYGSIVSSSSAYNLIGIGGSDGLTNGTNGNQVGVADPGLGTLASNGGPTQTIALLPSSPAIDAGSNALAVDPTTGNPLTTDQRGPGFPRIVNGTVDIGAYEFQGAIVAGTAVGWGSQSAALQTAADGLRLLPAGRNTDLPWLGINQLSITLSQAETLTAADVTLSSAIGLNYGPVTVTGSGTSYTITLAHPINVADRLTIIIGNANIGTFTRRLDVLPGDFNDDGVVNSQDLAGIRNEWLGIGGAKPTLFGDINGDGTVNVLDYNAERLLIGTSLPAVSSESVADVTVAVARSQRVSVGIGGLAPVGGQAVVARIARAAPRAEIQLALRGRSPRVAARVRVIAQGLLEKP